MDAFIENHGTIYLVRPATKAATKWIAENVQDDAQFIGNNLAVEPRYLGGLVEGMSEDGLKLVFS
jgi:hypothetical protein